MSNAHCPAERLLISWFVAGEESGETATHVEGCESCRGLFDELRLVTRSIGRSSGREPRLPDPSMVESLETMALDAERERAEVEEAVAGIASSGDSIRAGAPRTLALAKRLGVEVREWCQRDPREALRLALLGIEVAEGLVPRDVPSRIVIGEAWKDKANAERLLGRFSEAHDSLARARSYFEDLAVPGPWLAKTDFVEATLLREQGRLDQAALLCDRSAGAFELFGLKSRVRHAGILRGNILAARGQLKEACKLWVSLLSEIDPGGELIDVAFLNHNLGAVLAQLGDFDEAESRLLAALSIYEPLELDAGRVRARWGLANVCVARGQIEKGLTWLEKIRDQFSLLEMNQESAIVALDIVDAMLASSAEGDLPAICRELVEHFARSGSSPYAIRALSYLKEALERETATPSLVRYLRGYLGESDRNRAVVFAPPAPGSD